MISLLARIFISGHDRYDDTVVRRKYGILCGTMGIFFNIILFAFKYFAGVISGSVAIMADAFNNLSDAGSSIITLIGFKFSGMKPDREHPFGHGRIEYVSGLIVSLIIMVMGIELGKSSIGKIIHPETMDTGIWAFVILIFSVLVKLYMAYYNHSVGKKIKSATMKATATDSISDVISTSVVFLSMVIYKLFKVNIDGYCGALVAVFILFAGFEALKDTLSPLVGLKPDEEYVRNIERIALSFDKAVGVHDVMVHDYGPGRRIVSLHVEVPGDEDIYELHELIETIEEELDHSLDCESVIHMDPVEVHDAMVLELKKQVGLIVKGIDGKLSIHDFRVVPAKTYKNIIFDVVVPQEFYLSDGKVKQKILDELKEKLPECRPVIKVEKSYI